MPCYLRWSEGTPWPIALQKYRGGGVDRRELSFMTVDSFSSRQVLGCFRGVTWRPAARKHGGQGELLGFVESQEKARSSEIRRLFQSLIRNGR